jgi:site-specific DNA-cytosine methylase
MEPVTYFVTYGTAMAAYAYYVLTKQEYNLPDVRDRQYLITMHKRAKKGGLDLDQYNVLKKQIAEVEYDLKRLRDPLQLHLPSNLIKQTTAPLSNFDDLKALVSSKTNLKTGIQDLFSSVKNRK